MSMPGMHTSSSAIAGGCRVVVFADETMPSALLAQSPMDTCGLTEEASVIKYPNVDVLIDGAGRGWQDEYFKFTDSKERAAYQGAHQC